MNNSYVPNNFDEISFEYNKRDLDIVKGLTIIAVDDDKDILVLITEIFEPYGIKVLTALSAISAFEIIKNFPVDLLISDIAMTEEDGYWLIQKVRSLASQQKREIPAVAFTGNTEYKARNKAFVSGFKTYIQKPSDVEQLVTEVAKLLKCSAKSISL
ncbi:response regulator [Nostoc sp. UHCC 0302]|uniref:response regulator n=1 Tax=Nostoc sp. UHCC 0302 TaxID=3134896 RepID=UPI00311C9D91